jgi:hypothetical protein
MGWYGALGLCRACDGSTMEYCVMCVDTGCFGAKVKLIFLFSVSHSSKTVGPRDCGKLQRYSCYCAIHSYKSNSCCTEPRITKTIISSEIPASWSPCGERDRKARPSAPSNSNLRSEWNKLLNFLPKEPHFHRYSIPCKSQVSPQRPPSINTLDIFFHKVSNSTKSLMSPKTGDSRRASCLLAKSASFAYLKRAQTRLTGHDSVFAIRAALFDIILRVGVTNFGYLDRR